MSSQQPIIPIELEQVIFSELSVDVPVKEYELMQQLHLKGFEMFQPSLDELTLFRAHFLLFHILYRLQDKWLAEKALWLEIHSLSLQLYDLNNSVQLPIQDSQLKQYYLNYEHFLTTQATEVQALLNDFWSRFSKHLNAEELQIHLTILALPTDKPLTRKALNSQYRHLSQRHHPDKGGDKEQFQQINHAVSELRQYLTSIGE